MRVYGHARSLIAALMVLALIGCSRPPDVIGVVNPNVPVSSVEMLSKHRIFIMTTRESTEAPGSLFSSSRAPSLGLASVDATVPPTHVTGVLERPRRLPPDPRTEFTVVNPIVYEQEGAFIASVNRELAKRPPAQRKVLFFVHGFNNSTSEAVLRLSQFVEDTGFQGVPILFSWASAAAGSAYVYDLNSVLVARSQLYNMTQILGKTNAQNIDVFAHSMGTLLVMEGLVNEKQSGRLANSDKIDIIVLASPDIDIDLFETQVAALPRPLVEKMFLLISEDDAALRLSRRIAGGVPRVGAADVAQLERFGATVIDLGKVSDSNSGSHSKFAGSPEVVQLIGAGLNADRSFGAEGRNFTLEEVLGAAPIRIFRN
ncbi:alpha/beta hydrolase [Tateyamaria pelophila]|uniref:alpha/beta hydrolase n=1 Tax=Tateyamaria pelophila TaxID=328415 RepID=UPI001CBB52E2|nr:alpha/beta hydrolase [Tateyamaria pelophila]